MKMRSVTLLMIVALCSSVMVFAQKEESTRELAPIVASVDGFNTGVTVVNPGDNSLTVTNFRFFSTTGTAVAGAEAAEVDRINKQLAGLSFSIPAFGRFSRLITELISVPVNGSLHFSVIGNGAQKAQAFQAVFDLNFGMDTIETVELTRRDASPRP